MGADRFLASVAGLLVLGGHLAAAGVVEDKYSCPHGWTRYGGKKCLKYVNELQDYERAQTTCRSKNQGTLVTIHTHDEQNFVYSYIHSIAASSTPIWLGAKQSTFRDDDLRPPAGAKLRLNLKLRPANATLEPERQQIDFESILWLDKTENTFTNWAASEPSHPDEICIAINPRTGLWHDVMCTETNVPACERAPTTQWPFFVAFCSEGWFQFNDEKCVRIISSQALNFYESQELCRSKYNSKLLSIKTDKESEFVHNLIKFRDVKLPVWLGAVQNDFSSFNWIDKSDVTFTNWLEGEPNDPDHACLSMTASGGKWADNDCKEQKLILCQKVPEDSGCETGWLQFRQDKCYRFVHIRLAFDDAESLCNNLYGGHLPSIHSQEEQFMITQFLASVNVKNGSEVWLGGRQMDFHNFNWGDGSQFNYSYWEHGEPNFPAEKCIEMSWRNGRWNDISCRLKRAVLCERQVASRHHLKPNLYQPSICLESNCSASATASGGTSLIAPLLINGSSESSTGDSPVQGTMDVASGAKLNASAEQQAGGLRNSSSDAYFPIDDKPIKVITSIMHRENSAASLEAANTIALSANNATGSGLNATSLNALIHYNLPPPDQIAAPKQPTDQHQPQQVISSPQPELVSPVPSIAATESPDASSLLYKLRNPVRLEANTDLNDNRDSLLNMAANSTVALQSVANSQPQADAVNMNQTETPKSDQSPPSVEPKVAAPGTPSNHSSLAVGSATSDDGVGIKN